MRKTVFLLLLLFSFAFAYPTGTVQLYPFEYKDFGNASLPTFDMTLMMNCHGANISAYVRSDGQPVSGASSNLKYVQYDNPLISTGTTNAQGVVTHKLSGNISFMTGIFVLTVEKSGYQRREAHFLISPCFSESTPSEEQGGGSVQIPVQNTSPFSPPSNPATNASVAGNVSGNESGTPAQGQSNQTGNQTGASTKSGNGGLCPLGFALLLFALSSAFSANRR